MNENNIQKNEELLYREWVPAGKFVKSVIIFVFLLILTIGIIFTTLLHRQLLFIGILFGGVCLFILLLYWNFRGLKITLTKNQLEIVYGIFNHKRIPLQKIAKCEITKARFRTYGGVGIRFGFDGSWAYNTDFGEAVKLFFEKGRPFVFSTRNSQKICNLIDKLSREYGTIKD
ncbi:hypothetical protein LCGC14_2031120 [marine sediment metagenome]|uniref:Bacterial Pleckstrin homology domain-containing protein n=1 Tax=marine sediment metagenome TaxID=412755 RepID=A0A0F9H845_9ZZZZ